MACAMERDGAIRLFAEALESIGYANSIELAFPVPGMTEASQQGQVDLVAFADSLRKDQETACIAAEWKTEKGDDSGLQTALRRLACPVGAVLYPQQISIFPVRTGGRSEARREVISYGNLREFVSKNETSLRPAMLAQAKRQPIIQRTLFDFDPTLLDYAREVAGRVLCERVQSAYEHGLGALLPPAEGSQQAVLAATLRLVAAQAVAEKLHGVFQDDIRLASADILLGQVRRYFKDYFPPRDEEVVGSTTLDEMLSLLRTGMSYRALTNDVLSDVYENVFLGPQDTYRREYGIHYTPPKLARRIVEHLPVEWLPPDRRKVLDPTCGSGTFLRAAYDRLEQLLPRWYSATQRHQYLSEQICGMDADAVAREIAVISLLLHSLPSGNSWQVKHGRFPEDLGDLRPTIIVGNPPFGGEDQEGSSRPDQMRGIRRRAVERAVPFLEHSLDILPNDGLLAMILPESLLSSSKATAGRDKILSCTDILEIWHLPRDIMPASTAPTAVVFAVKKEGVRRSFPVKVQWTIHRKEDRANLEQHGIPTFFTIAEQQEWQKTGRITAFPMRGEWLELQHRGMLGQKAVVRNGQPATGGQASDSPHGSGRYLWLGSCDDLHPYSYRWTRGVEYVEFPGTFDKPVSYPELFLRPKVIVNQKAIVGGNPWRLYGAIDRKGVYPAGTMHCVVPRTEGTVTLEEVAAVLNGSVANAYMYFASSSRSNSTSSIKRIPFPVFSQSDRVLIRQLVTNMESMGLGVDEAVRKEVFLHIDRIVTNAYRLSGQLEDIIVRLFAGFGPPKQTWRIDSSQLTDNVIQNGTPIVGVVDEVNKDCGQILIWPSCVSGENKGMWVDVPPESPGWILRPGAEFLGQLVLKPDGEPHLQDIRALDYGYLDDDQLLRGEGD
ncbi:MAG TPA: N-6 DNA methylase [Armatimonadota bacterium]|nr:N-6 DNA methylase [Armatimonadota bacterium]